MLREDPTPDDHVPTVGWKERVRFYDRGPNGPIAYRPKDILRAKESPEQVLDAKDDFGALYRTQVTAEEDLLAEVLSIRCQNVIAQPNHVYFTHCYSNWSPAGAMGPTGNPAFANPAFANPAFANPAFANPAFANPAFANPAFANPAFANPAFANPAFANPAFANPSDPVRTTGLRRSSARPPVMLDIQERKTEIEGLLRMPPVVGGPRVFVLDTGLAFDEFQPTPLAAPVVEDGVAPMPRSIDGDALDVPDSDNNKFIDGAAGHGTFIAGIVAQVAPGCHVTVRKVLTSYGDGEETAIVDAIEDLVDNTVEPIDDRCILNLSFGGYVWEQPFLLATAIRRFQQQGGVVVASAGNDATFVPNYPAALHDVVSVAAIGPYGPASFTNYGPWVRACAPGVDILSLFFRNFQGLAAAGVAGFDPDEFDGWALWSGTSFAAPVVAGALARFMMARDCSAKEAVTQVIDAPSLMRLPNMGTVVNVI